MGALPLPVRRPVTPATVLAVRPGDPPEEAHDRLATEEPLEIRVRGTNRPAIPVAVTLRTPGNDFELAVGFLHGEGLIGPGDVASVRYCDTGAPGAEQQFNVVTVDLNRPFSPPAHRNFTVTSSCGLCGKTTLDEVAQRCPAVTAGPVLAASVVARLPDRLRQRQRLFEQTGGLHAAGLFDGDGRLQALREDVGRHNAVDKVVGHALLGGRLPLADHVLVLSGRVGFELVQKAAMAGVGFVAAVSAPSSLAVEAADRLGVTVAGFVRQGRCNIYSHPERVDAGA